MTAHPTATTPPTTPARRRRRLLRRAGVALLVLALLAITLRLVVTSSWFLTGRIEPLLSARLGGAVQIEHAAYEGAGRIALEGLVLRCPGVRGPAGRLVRVQRALVVTDPGRFLSGQVHVTGLELDGLHLRISEDARDLGVFNFMRLKPEWGDGDGATPLPSYVTIRSAVIDVGAHDGETFELVGRSWVGGEMAPVAGADGLLAYALRETDEGGDRPAAAGIQVTGRWNVLTNEHETRVEGLALDDRTWAMCPSAVRLWWQRMDLAGRVRAATIAAGADRSVSVVFEIENVEMTLPVEVADLWARFENGRIVAGGERPRMRVTSGTIRWENDGLTLEALRGEVRSEDEGEATVPVPYEISMEVPRLPELEWARRHEWLDDVLEVTPFEMTIKLADFSVSGDERGRTPAVALPQAVARILAQFQVTSLELTTEVTVRRRHRGATTEAGEPGIESEGRAFVSRATGAYRGFPYRLDDIDAYVEFDHRQILIHYLDGHGSDGVPIRVTGRIYPPSLNPAIELDITARDAPLDERFRAALRPTQAVLFDSLLHTPSHAALGEAGLLPDDEFELGGRLDLDLRIRRLEGRRQPVTIAGTIGLGEVGIVYEKFPYPVTIGPGVVTLAPDGLSVAPGTAPEGLPLRGAGGTGVLAGTIDFDRTRGRLQATPQLEVRFSGEPLSDRLVLAIPPHGTAGDPPPLGTPRGPGAAILHDLGLTGEIAATGRITGRGDGGIDYDFDLDVTGGTASPRGGLTSRAGGGLSWPAGWGFRDIEAAVHLTRDTVEVTDMRGRNDQCTLAASGTVELGPDARSRFRVDFDDVDLGPFLLDVLPPEARDRAEIEWDRYRPGGRFDAALLVDTARDGGPLELRIVPGTLGAELEGRPMQFARAAGSLAVAGGAVRADGLMLDVLGGDRDDGRIALDGAYDAGADGLRLDAVWSDGRLGCPLVDEALARLLGVDAQLRYRSLRPEGSFTGRVMYRGRPGEPGHAYSVTVEPRSIAVTVRDTPIYGTFEPGGRVAFTPGRIELEGLHGTHGGGSLDVAGVIDLDGPLTLDLGIDYIGGLTSGPLATLLPDQARNGLAAIAFEDGEASEVRGGRLRMSETGSGGDDRWRASFEGRVITRGATFKAGVPFEDVSGVFDVHAQATPGRPPQLQVDASDVRLRVYDEPLTAGSGRVRLAPGGDAVSVTDVGARLHGGAATAEAWAGLGSDRRYDVAVNLAGVDLAALFDDGEPTVTRDGKTGLLYAGVAFSGERGRPDRRRGRGQVRAVEDISGIPLALQVMQLTHVSVPAMSGKVDYAEIDFFIAGDWLTFENILFESTMGEFAPLQIFGDGVMSLDTFELDTRFRTRGGWLLFRDLVGGLGDQLYTIEVTGHVRDPQARVVLMPNIASGGDARSTAAAETLPAPAKER